MGRTESLFNDGWSFRLDSEDYKSVEIPHDWLIGDVNNLYKTGTGYYRKIFFLEKKVGKKYLINFDGIYMDSTVYVNGKEAGTNRYGYSSFEYDITELLVNGKNRIDVEVRFVSPNSRWYSGAGIFRDIIFKEVNDVHIASSGVYVNTSPLDKPGCWKVTADIELEGIDNASFKREKVKFDLSLALLPSLEENLRCICRNVSFDDIPRELKGNYEYTYDSNIVVPILIESRWLTEKGNVYRIVFSVDNVYLWDITSPNLYSFKVDVSYDESLIDSYDTRFGFRTVEFTTDSGMLLNGRNVKINGVCEHHDLGLFGAAFNKDAMKRKFSVLKEMGVNAVRTSHNMPARGFMELADEMGIMIDSEAFDMWIRPKTEYDYARFFKDNYRKDIISWVRRDRNCPSVIMWSIGNEIYDCHADESAPELTADMKRTVEDCDYMYNATATHASNFMAWQGARNCADVLKLAGYNYGERLYDAQHNEHPDWMIYGSETCATVQSRGIYHFPLSVALMADDDEQCSSLGNCSTSWGAPNSEYAIIMDRDRKYSAGQFLWSGFDYIGEPTPYHTKNSYFGQIDTAGFPKDTFYIFKGSWTDPEKAPFVHVFPYWDFNNGQMIDVRVATNGDRVEIYNDGLLLGAANIDHKNGEELVPSFRIRYNGKPIKAIAYLNGTVIAETEVNAFTDAVGFKVTESYKGKDIRFFEISAVDKDGRIVENANNRVKVETVSGKLLGLDNGDSTDYDEYLTDTKRLFSGKLLAAVKGAEGPDPIRITLSDEVPIRKLEITADETLFTKDRNEITVKAVIFPENATYSDIRWTAVNEKTVQTNIVKISPFENENGHFCTITAKGDGDFSLRAMAYNGERVAKVISSLEFRVEGIGSAGIDPYSFVSASLYTDSYGDIGNGNEKGIATPRGEGSYFGFNNVDFGDIGSDEITIPIFTLNDDEYSIGIWEGKPNEPGSTLLCDGRYCKKSIWNVYQPETYHLNKKLTGITDIYFTADDKYHMKGFEFKKPDKAFELLYLNSNSRIYGDTFEYDNEAITGIGNNVFIEFDDMDFKDTPASKIIICGRSKLENNSIHLKFDGDEGSSTELLEFPGSDTYVEREYVIKGARGKNKVGFVFLPGCDFDFKYFKFIK
ncbi:MAG: DUF4982 domain-containing protein [Lachnospiraceae bacterium]|nr:DUF4982 domain-containing protein [Lachnospiraceae bacterium]